MADFDDLARRAVGGVTRFAARATRFARFVLIAAVLVVTTSFVLGLVALEGGMRTVWVALGLAFGGMAIGSAFLARWRLASIGRHTTELIAEVRALIEYGHPATRTVIDAVESDEREGGGSVLVVSREFFSLRDAVGVRVKEFRKLTSAVAALSSFPGLVLGAIGITVVFAVLVPIFVLALAVA